MSIARTLPELSFVCSEPDGQLMELRLWHERKINAVIGIQTNQALPVEPEGNITLTDSINCKNERGSKVLF